MLYFKAVVQICEIPQAVWFKLKSLVFSIGTKWRLDSPAIYVATGEETDACSQSRRPTCCFITDRKSMSVHKAPPCSQLSRMRGEEEEEREKEKKNVENGKESC